MNVDKVRGIPTGVSNEVTRGVGKTVAENLEVHNEDQVESVTGGSEDMWEKESPEFAAVSEVDSELGYTARSEDVGDEHAGSHLEINESGVSGDEETRCDHTVGSGKTRNAVACDLGLNAEEPADSKPEGSDSVDETCLGMTGWTRVGCLSWCAGG